MIDDNQKILVIAPVGGAAVTTANDRVLWYIDGGTPRPIAREGTQAFGMPSGAFYGIVNSSPRISGNGRIMFSSTMLPETGNTTTGLVTTGAVGRNDSAIWVTDVSGGAKSVLVRRGDDADAGTFLPAGVFHDTAFALSQQGTSLNNNGLAFFQGTLGGTGVVTANNQAFFVGAAGSVNALPLRKGDGVALDSSNPGVDPNPTVGAFGFNMQINASGQAFFDTTYATSAAPTVINNHNNYRAWSFNPASPTIVTPGMRESAAASPTIAGGAILDSAAFQGWSASLGFMGFNNAGQFVTPVNFLIGTGTPAVDATNDAGILRGDLSGNYELLLRKGDPAPFTDGLMTSISTSTINLNNNGDFTFRVFATGGTVTTDNDLVIAWCTGPNSFLKIHREGDAVPHVCGATFTGDLSSTTLLSNNARQVVMPLTMTGPGVTAAVDDRGVFCWSPLTGLRMLARQGDQIEVSPGNFKTVSSTGLSWIVSNNGNGRQMGLTDDGHLAARVFFSDGSNIIAHYVIPSCPGDLDDGSGTGRPDGGVDINDLLYFLAAFEAGSLNADVDDDGDANILPPTPDCGTDINDLLFFLGRFEQGC